MEIISYGEPSGNSQESYEMGCRRYCYDCDDDCKDCSDCWRYGFDDDNCGCDDGADCAYD